MKLIVMPVHDKTSNRSFVVGAGRHCVTMWTAHVCGVKPE